MRVSKGRLERDTVKHTVTNLQNYVDPVKKNDDGTPKVIYQTYTVVLQDCIKKRRKALKRR